MDDESLFSMETISRTNFYICPWLLFLKAKNPVISGP